MARIIVASAVVVAVLTSSSALLAQEAVRPATAPRLVISISPVSQQDPQSATARQAAKRDRTVETSLLIGAGAGAAIGGFSPTHGNGKYILGASGRGGAALMGAGVGAGLGAVLGLVIKAAKD